jgi:DNA-binding MarR family transcriptional regulator
MTDRRPPTLDLHRYPFFWMTRVTTARDGTLAQELKPLGLRVPEWRVLALVSARQRLSMKELSELSSIDRTTLTRTVDRMVDCDLLVRDADDDDMRITRISLTAGGRRLFEKTWPIVDKLNRMAVQGLPPGVIDLLGWTLETIAGNLSKGTLAGEEEAQG